MILDFPKVPSSALVEVLSILSPQDDSLWLWVDPANPTAQGSFSIGLENQFHPPEMADWVVVAPLSEICSGHLSPSAAVEAAEEYVANVLPSEIKKQRKVVFVDFSRPS